MKRLCFMKSSYEITLKTGKTHRYSNTSSLRYTDVQSKDIKIEDWDEFVNAMETISDRREEEKMGKKFIRLKTFVDGYPEMIKVPEDKFKDAVVSLDVEYAGNRVTMSDLIKRLSADEFIEFSKDNGIAMTLNNI